MSQKIGGGGRRTACGEAARAFRLDAPFFSFRETDVDEVLQTTSVFSNVSRGILAKAEDLRAAFGTDDEAIICLRILKEGDVQVSDKERELEYGTAFTDVAALVASRCVSTATRRPFTAAAVERALKGAGFAVDPRRAAKQQVGDAVRALADRLPLERARMRLRVGAPAAAAPALAPALVAAGASFEAQDMSMDGATVTYVILADPGAFRALAAAVAGAGGGARMEVVDVAAVGGGGEAPAPDDGPPPSPTVTVASGLRSLRVDGGEGGSGAPPGALPAAAPPPPRASGPAPPLYPRGPVAGLPETMGARRDMFAALDALQPGWEVELAPRAGAGGDAAVDATFFSPAGDRVPNFAAARRQALAASRR